MSDERPDAVHLPEHGDGSRRALHAGDGDRRRRALPRWLVPWGAAVGVLIVVGLLVGSAVGGDGKAGQPKATPRTTAGTRAHRSSGLLLQRDAGGALVGATLLVVGPSGSGGDIVYIPLSTLLEGASLGVVPVREAARQGDRLVGAALENVFGELFGSVVVVDSDGLVSALRPAGTLQVDGRSLPPEKVPEYLARPVADDAALVRTARPFWTAWLSAIDKRGLGGAPSTAVLGLVAEDVRKLAAGEVAHHVLPVQPMGGKGSFYRVDQAKLARLLPSLLPDAPLPAARISVRVLNGSGTPGAAQGPVPSLVEAGARVVLTGNADRFDYTTTQFVYYDDAHAADARRLRDALGVGDVVKSLARLEVVHVTVVVGTDLASPPESPTPNAGATP